MQLDLVSWLPAGTAGHQLCTNGARHAPAGVCGCGGAAAGACAAGGRDRHRQDHCSPAAGITGEGKHALQPCLIAEQIAVAWRPARLLEHNQDFGSSMHAYGQCKAGQAVRKTESDSTVMFSTRLQLSEPVPATRLLHAACQVGIAPAAAACRPVLTASRSGIERTDTKSKLEASPQTF